MTLKKITLHSPTILNSGAYVDSGATITIGDHADEIAADRAKAMVDTGLAVSETAAKAEFKASN